MLFSQPAHSRLPSNKKKKRKTPSGFTLIEIMIAMAIMSSLTIFTAQSIRSALSNSRKHRKRIEETAEIRDVLRVMERDINLAFHHRNVQQEVLDKIKSEKTSSSTSEENNNSSANNEKEKPNFTQFIGKKNSLHFTTLSHTRTMVDSQDSDQAEIGYFLKSCRNRSNKKNSKCLWRRVSTVLDDETDKGGIATVIIENVKSFTFRYIGKARDNDSEAKWIDRWDSSSNFSQQAKDKFPKAVEITLIINRLHGEKKIEQKKTIVAALRFPNNYQKPEDDSTENKTSNNDETNAAKSESENK